MLPSPLDNPPLRELPGACAIAARAVATISPTVKTNLFTFME
jgi:hypothetical protein